MRSPFDGASRRALRIGIGAVAAVDVAALAYALLDVRPSALSHPRASGALLALGGRPLLIAPIAAAGILGALLFARRPARIAPGLVALAALAVLCESHGAILVGPMRVFFTSGAVLLGWIAGLAFARWMGESGPASEDRAEALAEAGAVAALAATYVGAAASKLLASGLSWADANTLRAIVLLQRGLPGRSPFDFYAEAVLTYPAIAWTLSALTLVTQASAIFYPWTPRLRAICGTLLLAFHLNVWLLTPIFFPQAMVLLILLSYPWPRIWARLRSPSQSPEPSPPPEPSARASLEAPPGAIRAAALRTGAVTLALIALAAMPFIRAYTHLHHRREPSAASETHTKSGPDVRALLAGVTEGGDLAGFHVEEITGPKNGAVEVKLSRGSAAFTVALTKRGARGFEPPRKSARYDLFYDRVRPDKNAVPLPDIDRALSEIASRLAATESAVPPPAGL